MIVDHSEVKKIDNIILNGDYSFQNISPSGDYYLYEGELIWSDLMPYNEKSEERVDVIKNKQVIDSKKSELYTFYIYEQSGKLS